MAIRPEDAKNYTETIDFLEQEIDDLIVRTPEKNGYVTIMPPIGFEYKKHFVKIKALYLQSGWKSVSYDNGEIKFEF
jgi:hypothetical protein